MLVAHVPRGFARTTVDKETIHGISQVDCGPDHIASKSNSCGEHGYSTQVRADAVSMMADTVMQTAQSTATATAQRELGRTYRMARKIS